MHLVFSIHRGNNCFWPEPPLVSSLSTWLSVVAFWVFASEVKAIIASGLVDRQADQRALAGFLAYGAI
jgi:hypothetical protein